MAAIDFPNDPDTGDGFSQSGKTWVYNGDAWSLVTSPTAIPAGAITAAMIATGAITSTNLATGATNNYVLTADSSLPSGIKWSQASASINALDDISDVSASTPTSGHFLKWNGSAWVNDAIDLGTDTTGNYMSGLSVQNGLTVSHTPSEGSTATVGVDNALLSNFLLDGASGNSYGLIGTSVYLDVKNTNGYNKEIELDITAVKNQLNTDGYLSGAVITSVATGQVLQWNGTNWVNAAASSDLMTSSKNAALIVMDIGV